jgi:predicted RNA methylase
MTGPILKENLLAISKDILNDADFHEKLAPAILKYHELLCEVAAIDPCGESDREHIETGSGNAIGPFWAANCVKEVFRTQRFIKGLAHAINDLHHQGQETVHVLYAGTGPFATLALPIMLHFEPSQVQFTLLEINENSYNRLHALLEQLDLMPYVRRLELADATTYKIKDNDIAIVLSETMDLALFKEPQVGIMLNLGGQLADNVICIPQQIKVSACKQTPGNKLQRLETLLRFDRQYISDKVSNANQGRWEFEKVEVEVDVAENERLYYLTEITIYGEYRLLLNDSSLTLLRPINSPGHAGKLLLEFQYQISENPGFLLQVLNNVLT